MRVVAVVPALDEEGTIGDVVRGLYAAPGVHAVVVADNASRDRTCEAARAAGADVVHEPRRGYGAACLAGIRRARELGASIVLLCDGDGSDDPAEAPRLIAPIRDGMADLVLGVRTRESTEPGAMTWPQKIGNRAVPLLLRATTGARYADLPPYKAIRASTLELLDLEERGGGFTIELLLAAHQARLRVREVEVRCRARRAGTSKVSGNARGALGAAAAILGTIVRRTRRRHDRAARGRTASPA
ncbi:MAG: glycosyltransferase [Deltaproteobacteria bacterium]|nr:glycosyltransferase [Deltaproteobacteria bacterium]